MKRKCFGFFVMQLLPCLLLLGALAFSRITDAKKTVKAGAFQENANVSIDGFSSVASMLAEQFLHG